MKKHTEIEARWINLDEKLVLKKLKQIGAKQTGNYFFREWIFQRPEWSDEYRRIRVRTDGTQTWLTYKANATWKVDSTDEVEVTVSSADDAVRLLQIADLPLVRYQEKKRKTFVLDGITFDVDKWPMIPMVFEIEADSEKKVREGATLMGFSWDDAVFEDQAVVHKKYFNIDLSNVSDYRF